MGGHLGPARGDGRIRKKVTGTVFEGYANPIMLSRAGRRRVRSGTRRPPAARMVSSMRWQGRRPSGVSQRESRTYQPSAGTANEGARGLSWLTAPGRGPPAPQS